MPLRERLRNLERIARRLDPSSSERGRMANAAVRYGDRFLAQLGELGTYRGKEPRPQVADFALAEDAGELNGVLRTLDRKVTRPGINPAGRGHFGYIPGGGLYPAALGDFIADVTNRYSGVYFANPGAAVMERALVEWMAKLVGYPEGAGGDLTSGGSIANLSAVVAAREAFDLRARDYERVVVYLTEQTHHCVDKALRVAGLADCTIQRVPMDDGWRMRPAALDAMVRSDRKAGLIPWLVVGSGGTTDTGAVDPLADIADVAEDQNLWYHCDAAYGGFFLLTDYGREKLAGIERSESAVLDPHKGLFMPFGSGALLVRDESQLASAMAATANYMQDARRDEPAYSPADLSPELTRPFRGLRMWLPLKLFGLRPFRACLDEKLLLARYFHAELAKVPGFEVGPPPDLSVVTYRYRPDVGDPDDFNRALLQAVHDDGKVFVSSTVLDGHFTLRLAALHFRAHLDEVDYLLELLRYHARRLLGH
jgi:glutamate/tyrosine decarboxylase-like PLP-dependent enzyme